MKLLLGANLDMYFQVSRKFNHLLNPWSLKQMVRIKYILVYVFY